MHQISVLTDEPAIDTLADEWRGLDARLSPRTPFTSPEWCRAWWRHFRRSGMRATDRLRIYVIRDASGALVCVAPMFVTSRPGVGPIQARELQFFGADAYVTELRGPCCRPEDLAGAMAALAAQIAAEGICDWVQWRGLPKGFAFEGCGLPFQPQPALGSIDYFIHLKPSWEEFRSGLPRNIKESLRKCYNSLARDGIGFTFEVVDAPERVPEALERFFDLHGRRAELDGTVAHANAFGTAAARAFLRDYAGGLAAAGRLRIFQLKVRDEVVATRVGFLHGDELYLYFSGYDPAYGRYSIMTTTVAEALKWAIGAGVRIVNLSSGTDVSKTRWRPDHVERDGGYLHTASGAGRLAFQILQRLRHSPQPRDQSLDHVA